VTRWLDHLMIVPVVLPLATGALLLLLGERRRTLKAAINVVSTVVLLGAAIALLRLADAPPPNAGPAAVGVYLLGNWPAPFGIVLALDRLSALMLVLTGVLALAAAVYSLAQWHKAGAHFHSLFQFLVMGLNGSFLTGDLFNLFVFFEVLLAASYGLVLHGSGTARVRAGLHYIAVNLAASLLFLIGVSLIYGVTGTLNMADLATRVPAVPAQDRMLLEAGAAVLGIAFLVKAAMWPLGFWLPTAYSAASPPAAAILSITSKVGVYVVLRLWLLVFGDEAGASARFGGDWLLVGGMMTIAFGAIGVLASQNLARLGGFSVLVSSGTMLASIGIGQSAVTGATLFYLASSTLAIGAYFLLIELAERDREAGADMLAVTAEAYGEGDEDDWDEEEAGIAIPAAMAILGLGFMTCALVIAGLPPLSGFIAKFALLTAALNPSGLGAGVPIPGASWALLVLLIASGLATVVAMMRGGVRTFWPSLERTVPRVRIIEMAPVAVLLLLCFVLAVQAGPVMRYMQAAADSVHAPHDYMRAILSSSGVLQTKGDGGT
jgi:multicomponent K+:H+ antiporter subunit D